MSKISPAATLNTEQGDENFFFLKKVHYLIVLHYHHWSGKTIISAANTI